MKEKILNEALMKVCERELEQFKNPPPYRPSLRHRLAMRRIFALLEKNLEKNKAATETVSNSDKEPFGIFSIFSNNPHMSIKKRITIILILIICGLLMTGFIFGFESESFVGTVYTDNTVISPKNTKNCPQTIEDEYYLSEVPEGFELAEYDHSLSVLVDHKYQNDATGQIITFAQFAKRAFSGHYNTEGYDFENVTINGHAGLCLDFSNDERYVSLVVWDNEDYVFEIAGDLSKNDIIFLAESTKILEN